MIALDNDLGTGENCFICLRKNLKLRTSTFEHNEDGEEVVGSSIDRSLFRRSEIKRNANRKCFIILFIRCIHRKGNVSMYNTRKITHDEFKY